MSDVGEAIKEVRSELADAASEFMPDVCDLIEPTSAPDGYGGTTETSTSLATNVPCSYKASRPLQVTIAGGQVVTLDHELEMPVNAKTMAIKPHYQILVKANGLVSAQTFENPVQVFGSLSPLLKVAATLQI